MVAKFLLGLPVKYGYTCTYVVMYCILKSHCIEECLVSFPDHGLQE